MRAIILAAGMGTRLRPLTDNLPKGLIPVNGMPMVEKQVIFLKEAGIDEIIIVTGYMKEKYDYFEEKYGVKLIHNDKYDIYNNLYTMYLVREFLNDCYVLECDIYMNKNVIDTNLKETTYFGCKEKNFEKEWILKVDENNRIKEIVVGSAEEDIILRGISYWTQKDGQYIAEKMKEAVDNSGFDALYWDDIVKDNVKNINIFRKELNYGEAFEIDSLEDLKKVEEYVK